MEQNRTSILQMARGAIQERWKLEATRNIAAYFEEKLGELIVAGRVVVLR